MCRINVHGKSFRLICMIGLTSSYFFVEIIVGYVTNSIALVADSFHMLSDIVALIVGLASVRISKWESTKNTYGWVRAEVVGALVNSVFLLALCFSITTESLQRLVKVEKIENPKLLLIVGGIGLVVNLIGLVLFHNHAHSHGGGGHAHNTEIKVPEENKQRDSADVEHKEHHVLLDNSTKNNPRAAIVTNVDESIQTMPNNAVVARSTTTQPGHRDRLSSGTQCSPVMVDPPARETQGLINAKDGVPPVAVVNEKSNDSQPSTNKTASSGQLNMRGVFLHVLGDALGSVIVIISALVVMFVKESWRFYVDPALSIALVIIILITTIPLFRESSLILLQTVPRYIDVPGIRTKLEALRGVNAIHEFHVWQLAGQRVIASAHINCHDIREYMVLGSQIKEIFHNAGIHSSTIQPEFVHTDDVSGGCAFECGPEKDCHTSRCCVERVVKSKSINSQTPGNTSGELAP